MFLDFGISDGADGRIYGDYQSEVWCRRYGGHEKDGRIRSSTFCCDFFTYDGGQYGGNETIVEVYEYTGRYFS